ncbi:hypothetical protein A1OE_271 [Candidatus Endolissoclinum faulkneri L2]|uniref:Uncharacterized protein n=1 Tax=Candidatus Endolissoclinum faulkneri L2 TaxID=1193729 RepID=K7ZCD5_9PROT|nr:hypothetical protein A1OE_271 [Candidatus Endolissoclinum faulkneri L2]
MLYNATSKLLVKSRDLHKIQLYCNVNANVIFMFFNLS